MAQNKLNIGCGRDYRKGWINIDISNDVGADIVMDIRKDFLTYHTGSETVDEIYISGVLEQIGSNDDLIFVMNQCHDALKKGGIMTVIVPNARFAIAHRDPMDVRKFTKETFAYFLVGTQEYRLYGSVYGFKGWSTISIEENERHIMTISMTK